MFAARSLPLLVARSPGDPARHHPASGIYVSSPPQPHGPYYQLTRKVDELELHPLIAAPATMAAAIPQSILLLCISFPPVKHEPPRRNGQPAAKAA